MTDTDIDPQTMTNFLFTNSRKAPPVEIQPETVLMMWRVLERHGPNGLVGRHLSGWSADSGSLRLTSRIVEFDPKARVVVTESGRRYHIESAPTDEWIHIGIIQANAALNGIDPDSPDVSDAVWAEIMKAAH